MTFSTPPSAEAAAPEAAVEPEAAVLEEPPQAVRAQCSSRYACSSQEAAARNTTIEFHIFSLSLTSMLY